LADPEKIFYPQIGYLSTIDRVSMTKNLPAKKPTSKPLSHAASQTLNLILTTRAKFPWWEAWAQI